MARDKMATDEQTSYMHAATALQAGSDNHITKQDFLDQPEVGCNPMISRVVDVVLEDNGHASRRDFEGNFIEASFDDTEKERETGLHFDPANVVKERKKKVKSYGAIIEEVVPGSVAAQKGNLHSGMRLIGIKTKNDKMGTWNYDGSSF